MSDAPPRPRQVAVIGGGIAGSGAAVAAARAGVDVVLLDGGPGASILATGAIDLLDWQLEGGAPLPREIAPFLEALGGYVLRATERSPADGSGSFGCARLLTTGGISRPAAGHDAALLDVARAGPGPIGVVRCDRPGWDARALASAWGHQYDVVDATLLRRTDERALPDADFAARHDDGERLAWMGQRLREAVALRGGGFCALVLPPALGLEKARASELSEAVGVPCGEAVALPGGPAGLRFERARDRLLATSRVERVRARAEAIERVGDAWRVTSDDGVFEVDAVVLATGGLLGGGIEYRPSEVLFATALPPHAQQPLRLTLRCPVAIGVDGRPLEVPGSLFGVAPESLAWPFAAEAPLERAGVLAREDGAAGPLPGLFAAGEVVADAPRTWLAALASGLRAGAAAAARARARLPASDAASAMRP